MKCIRSILLQLLCIGGFIPQTVLGNTVMIENSSGQRFEMGIDDNDCFLDIINRIQSYFQQEMLLANIVEDMNAQNNELSGMQWNLVISHAGIFARAKQAFKRDYDTPVTKEQKEDISFLVTTLAWGGAIELGKKSPELNAVKPRIDNVHPLNFLYVIFSDDKLIAGITAIKERKLPTVKSRFFGELKDSLESEASRHNLLPFVDDFAKRLGISKKKIYASLEKGKYDEFIDTLIELKPREGADRHNM